MEVETLSQFLGRFRKGEIDSVIWVEGGVLKIAINGKLYLFLLQPEEAFEEACLKMHDFLTTRLAIYSKKIGGPTWLKCANDTSKVLRISSEVLETPSKNKNGKFILTWGYDKHDTYIILRDKKTFNAIVPHQNEDFETRIKNKK